MHEAERLRQRSLDGNLEQVRGLRVDRDGAVRLEECRDLILTAAGHSAERRVRVHWNKEEPMRVRRHAWVLCESEVVAVIQRATDVITHTQDRRGAGIDRLLI